MTVACVACRFFVSLLASCCLSLPSTYTSDFNYNTDGYDGDGAEDGKSQDSSETLPFIDESPTMSPQLCVPQGPDGEAVSPTTLEGDVEKGLEMKKLVLSGFLASEEIYINQLEALLLVRNRAHKLTQPPCADLCSERTRRS
ncbi:hypothetical protein CHARACLAT_022613 [Characodon lateralis]|uniref:Uncharacterized protein n=1 Tax=Characodon lateralis TaxID=208331 RepID=A0ABU7F565_9TELE|nr:hypothetical protein [Characodon lateralis]